MMDRQEQIGVHRICALGALDEAVRRRLVGNHKHGLVKTGIGQRLISILCELQIECVFRNAARTHRARDIQRVTDIENDTKRRAIALRGR